MKLREWLSLIEGDDRKVFLKIYDDYRDLFHTNPGSTHIHQNWKGGLADHLAMMCELAFYQYRQLNDFSVEKFKKKLPFTFSSVLKVIFLHDAEKVIVYGDKNDPRCSIFFGPYDDPTGKIFKESIKWKVLYHWELDYGLNLSDDETNAIQYTHGEGEDYRNDKRVMNELAAFVGNVDRISARIFYADGRGLGKE